ncbi:hypothetical protein [Pengzhenrongella phosphoraccumulans]|uniref:hypothetical protein n=1 Tax=Pengzhenrongella phosphoraccumulans TaxID=3114394 RepID=UPI00388FCEA5
MPKADRILANLPPTFRLRGDPSALRALVDGYGGELQSAENSLVAVMRAHWVAFADAGEKKILDLKNFGALYGLAPRDDESVEEFREHLRRYVRTQLDSTVTVEGILRTAAETLGLHLEDDALDAWWTRPDPVLLTSLPVGADAATAVLGVPAVSSEGFAAAPAVLTGDVRIDAGVDLSRRSTLRIAIDGAGATAVHLAAGAADPASVTADEILTAINAALDGVATLVDGYLVLTSPSTGPTAEISVADDDDDAADLVLGLRPRTYLGIAATRARIVGSVDLSTALDLTSARYLRLAVDATRLAEVDCAALAPDASAAGLGDVTDAINAALGITVASDDGRFLTLTSPTLGAAGSIIVLEPAAQPANERLLGQAPRSATGSAARRATVRSDRRIGLGVDLRASSVLRLQVDAEPPVSVDIAGLDPETTTPAEIVASVNEGLGATVASQDGDRLTLVSPTAGESGQLVVQDVDSDAADAVLGLRSRSARGAPPVTAAVTGTTNLAGAVDLSATDRLLLVLDDGAPVEVDLAAHAADRTRVTLEEIAAAINHALARPDDDPVASDDGAHLVLVSPTEGAGGRLVVRPLTRASRRRFVTRARVTDDASTRLLGFTSRTATATTARVARLEGTPDLSAGIDLTTDRWLRLAIGQAPAVDIALAGPRPRATTPAEVVAAVNAAFPGAAATDGHTVVLTDPVPGAGSRVVIEPPQALDALDVVLGDVPSHVRGRGAAGVRFVGTVDLTDGVSLPADAALRLGVDGAAPVDVPVGDGVATTVRPLSQLVAQINLAVGASLGAHDGKHLLLTCPDRLTIEAPTTGTDVTAAVLGVIGPRTYLGLPASPARIVGVHDLTAGVDLTRRHLLRLAVDRDDPVTVDLTFAADSPEHVPAGLLAAAINAATSANATTVAIPGGVALQITSPSSGPNSHLVLSLTGAGDAGPIVLGSAPRTATGVAPGPATVDGDVDLLGPVDLSDRSVLRLALDGGEPVDVDVAGVVPSATMLSEVLVAIDSVLPGVARRTAGDRLRLVSSSDGPESRVEVVPVRFLDLQEYPPTTDSATSAVRHGATVRFANTGAAAVPGRVVLDTVAGVAGPRLADPAAGWSVQLDGVVVAGGRLVLEVAAGGEVVGTITQDGHPRAASLLVTGDDPLTVRRGRNTWSYTECRAARFDSAVFDDDEFAGGARSEEAIFDLSRFGPSDVLAVFAGSGPHPATAQVEATWDTHQAGAFVVNLPSELDVRFGEPFGVARFGARSSEQVRGVVTEPLTDPDFLVDRLHETSRLVKAADPMFVAQVPIGWAPVTMPFREPAHLSLGRSGQAARLYVADPGFGSRFLVLEAAHEGAWGNRISMSARGAGPAIFDLDVYFTGSRFENARSTAFGRDLPTLAADLLAPRPQGVGTAKAAGIRARVTRDRVAEGQPRPDEEGTS